MQHRKSYRNGYGAVMVSSATLVLVLGVLFPTFVDAQTYPGRAMTATVPTTYPSYYYAPAARTQAPTMTYTYPSYYTAQARTTAAPTTPTTYQSYYYAPAATYAQRATSAQPAQAATSSGGGGDAGSFIAWLNGVRAQYGLPAVSYDANLTSWAAVNNAQQNARGLGHFVMGNARRQNAAMGGGSQIGAMWMADPPHRDALLDPTITRVGLAGSGNYWTFNAN